MSADEPADRGPEDEPFEGDPLEQLAGIEGLETLDALDGPDDEGAAPLTPHEREEVLADLEDVELFRVLLEPRGVKGLVVDCEDCDEEHFFGWDLLQSNLRQLLDAGTTRVHEPAFAPDASEYVSWEYARGWVDAVQWLTELEADDEDEELDTD